MNRRAMLGAIGLGVTSAAAIGAEGEKKTATDASKGVADRLTGKRVRIYADSLGSFFLGTVDLVEGTVLYLTNVKVPLAEAPRHAVVDLSSIKPVTILNDSE